METIILLEEERENMVLSHPSMPFAIVLRQEFGDENWDHLDIMVAFCRVSGLDLINDHLVRFIQQGGTFRILVGIDAPFGGTTREAITRLLHYKSLAPDRVVVGIVHYATPPGTLQPTFHPKVYAFAGADQRHVHVGSHNLTRGGLVRNIEAGWMATEQDRLSEHVHNELDSYIDEGTRCRLLDSHDDFERLLNTRHPRAGCYGNLIRSEYEEVEPHPFPDSGYEGIYDDELSNDPIGAGGIAYVDLDNDLQPWEEEAVDLGGEPVQQGRDEDIVAWSQQLAESHLVRNTQGNAMGGRLQLPVRGRGNTVPADDWAETRGQRFFRSILLPAEWWEAFSTGQGYTRYPSRQAQVLTRVHILNEERGMHQLTFVWSPAFQQDGNRNIDCRFSDELVALLNQPGRDGTDYHVIADRDVGDYMTLVRRGVDFFLIVSRDDPPTEDEIRGIINS